MNLHLHLQLVGTLQILLALLHITFPRRFGWKKDLSQLSLLNRQMFYVHVFFLCLILTLFGLLNLVHTDELLAPGALARSLLVGIAGFWMIRLLFQFFVYDPRLWRGHRFNTFAHVAFSLLWIYFTGVYAWAAWKGSVG